MGGIVLVAFMGFAFLSFTVSKVADPVFVCANKAETHQQRIECLEAKPKITP